MRAAGSAVYFAGTGRPEADARSATVGAARRIAALTHGDRAAREGTAVLHELLRVALSGSDPLSAVQGALATVHPDHRERWAGTLAPTWHPGTRDGFQRRGTALPGHRPEGAADDVFVRGRTRLRHRRGRRHRHGAGGDRSPGRCGVRLRGNPVTLAGRLGGGRVDEGPVDEGPADIHLP